MDTKTRIRTLLATAVLMSSSACTRTGVNAGEEGGKAFILFTVMLVSTVVILWFILGRED